ncbi:MAG: hypothetical protein IJB87_05715 [Alistipes sp.]|nr:hypothetical protein [Alistipes sp.]
MLILFSALMVGFFALADEGALTAMQRVARYVESLGRYRVDFVLKSGDFSAKGYYCVDGDAYYMNLGSAEIYSDGKTRYEVDHDRKEVNIDVVDLSSHNILDNPTRCFDFVGSDYNVESRAVATERVEFSLTPRKRETVGIIRVFANVKTGAPLALQYELYDEVVMVDILSIDKNKEPVISYRASNFRGYEIIDFR